MAVTAERGDPGPEVCSNDQGLRWYAQDSMRGHIGVGVGVGVRNRRERGVEKPLSGTGFGSLAFFLCLEVS